jgi:hypothetical protein
MHDWSPPTVAIVVVRVDFEFNNTFTDSFGIETQPHFLVVTDSGEGY